MALQRTKAKAGSRIVKILVLLVAAFATAVLAQAWFAEPVLRTRVDLAPNPATPRPASGPLRVHASNPRYFADASGRPVYLVGSHTWNNLQDVGADDPPARFDFDAYLQFLNDHRLNFIRLWRFEVPVFTDPETKHVLYCDLQPWRRSGRQPATDGKPQFDLQSFEPAYFERLRTRVEKAGRRGIYVSIMLFEGWALRFTREGWKSHPFHAANNANGIDGDTNRDGKGSEIFTDAAPSVLRAQEAYVRQVIDTVNDLDNVLYEISNENYPESFEWQSYFVRYMRTYEQSKPKQHPIGLTSVGFGQADKNRDTDRLFGSAADWVSPNPDKHDYRANPPATDGSKIVIADTDHLWGLGGDTQWVWKSFLRGINPIFMDPYRNQVAGEPAQQPQWESIRQALGHTAYFAGRIDLARMTPQPDLATTGYCLASAGSEYIIYLPLEPHPLESMRVVRRAKSAITSIRSQFAREVTVDLSAARAEFAVEWFDPAKGEIIRGTPVSGGASVSFTAPFNGDAVLYLRRAASLDR